MLPLTAGNRGPVNFSSRGHLVLVLQLTHGSWSRGCKRLQTPTSSWPQLLFRTYSACWTTTDWSPAQRSALAPCHDSRESAPTHALMILGLHTPMDFMPPTRLCPHFLLKSEFNPSFPILFFQMWDQEWEPDLHGLQISWCGRENKGTSNKSLSPPQNVEICDVIGKGELRL